jgi:Arc/MetJ-type ribon-helix-helix transcriptional regulator
VATEQIAVRLPEELLDDLDALVARGGYESRAAAVRAGIEAVIALERRRQIDRAIVAGYRRTPPTPAEHDAAFASRRHCRGALVSEPRRGEVCRICVLEPTRLVEACTALRCAVDC